MKRAKLRAASARRQRHPYLDYPALEQFVRAHFDTRLTSLVADPERQSLEGTLYGSVAFACEINIQHGGFLGGVRLANGWMMTTLLGEKISLGSDAASIERSLDIIERYCRHRITDEFLERFDAKTVASTSEPVG